MRVRSLKHVLGGIFAAALLAFSGPAAAQVAAVASEPARAADQAAAPAAPRPAIWLLQDEDTKIYLFGTVHVFPASLNWRSATLNRVIAEADELVMETPEASSGEMGDPSRLLGPMDMGKSIPILERVSPSARPRLAAVLAATGMPMAYFDSLHTWAVAFLLTGMQIADTSGGAQGVELSGAEEVLGADFRRRKKPISGVETMEDQINVFATMPIGAQRRFLESLVVEGDPDATPRPSTDNAWAAGDVEAIAAEMGAMSPELYHPLLTLRNRNWTAWLVRRLERPGTVLFAVGAGHLAGPDSVQRMLAEQGLEARRIE